MGWCRNPRGRELEQGQNQKEERQIALKTARTAKRDKDSAEEKTKPAGTAMYDNAKPKKYFRDG